MFPVLPSPYLFCIENYSSHEFYNVQMTSDWDVLLLNAKKIILGHSY